MAAFSVINFSDTSSNVVNVLQTSISDNTNLDNKREIIYYRKNQKIAPAMSFNNILVSNESKRKGRVKDVIKVQNPPPPIAVARRNARERNRVKQVNNGFAVLRQHIPTSITAASESENGRSKKLSKVETLRMAVEYIRRLEDMLSLSSSTSPEATDIDNDNSMSSYASYSMISTANNDQINNGYPIKMEMDTKMSRVPRTTTYQLIHSYEDEENIHPENMNDLDEDLLSQSHLMSTGIELGDSRGMSFIHSMHSTGSLSPEMNSEHSLSPRTLESDTKPYIMNDLDEDSKYRIKFPSIHTLTSRDGVSNIVTPVCDDGQNNLMNVTSWWEHEQLKS